MGIALRPPVGEILGISRSKSIENPLHFVNSECIWSRIVKNFRLRRAETKKIAPAAGNPPRSFTALKNINWLVKKLALSSLEPFKNNREGDIDS